LDNVVVVVEAYYHLDDVHNHFVASDMIVVEAYRIVDLAYTTMVFDQWLNDPFQCHSSIYFVVVASFVEVVNKVFVVVVVEALKMIEMLELCS